MVHRFDGYNYIVRLEKDELLLASLTKLAPTLGSKSVWVSGIGGALWAELGFYDLATKTYAWQRFDELLEITALQGNLAWQDAKPVWHLHGTFSTRSYNAIAGHVKELAVAGTCELLLHAIAGEPLSRTHSDSTGLNLLDL
jgi:predicted DNA-binding protein with PD1-like motif